MLTFYLMNKIGWIILSDYFKQELSDFKNSSKKLREDLLNYFRGIEFGASTLYDPSKWGSLVNYWPLDGDPEDDVGSSNFSLEGSPSYVTAVGNQGIQTNGTDQRLISSGNSLSYSNFTITCWANLATIPSDTVPLMVLQDGSNNLIAELNVDGAGGSSFRGSVDGFTNTVSSTTTASTGSDFHVALSYNGSQSELFVNGTSEGTLSYTFTPPTIDTVKIAELQSLWADANYFDEPMIHDTALTENEVNTLYQAGV